MIAYESISTLTAVDLVLLFKYHIKYTITHYIQIGEIDMSNTNQTPVVAYLRYSSHSQDNGNSIQSQMTSVTSYAAAHNFEVVEWYIDMAKTGRNTRRPEYQRMIQDLSNGTVETDHILVRDVDRLHRNSSNFLDDMSWADKLGKHVICVVDGMDTGNRSDRLPIKLKALMSEEYSDMLSYNTHAALLEAAKQCRHLGGTPPLGYRVDANGYYEIDEVTAPIVREIFRLYLLGFGYQYIIGQLKNKGYHTSAGNDFTKSSLNAILKNNKYAGVYTYDRAAPKDPDGRRNSHATKKEYISIPGGMPALISMEDFQAVQSKMAQHTQKHSKRTSKHHYPLNGLLHCRECGRAISGTVTGSHGKQYFRYKPGCMCGTKSIKKDSLDKYIFYAIQQCIFTPENKEKIITRINSKLSAHKASRSAEINALMNKIHGIEEQQSNLTQYLADGRGRETLLNQIDKNETELTSLKSQLEAASKNVPVIDAEGYDRLVKRFLDYMCNIRSPEAQALKTAAIRDITIDNEAVTIVFNPGVTADNHTIRFFNSNKEDY